MKCYWLFLFLIVSAHGTACELNASWEPWNPYQFKDKNGRITGLDNDLLMAVAKQANCTVKLNNTPWKRALQMLKEGKLDVTSGASKTQERAVYAFYSDPYRDEGIAVFLLNMNAERASFMDLNAMMSSDFSIGITRGYFYGDAFMTLAKKPQFNQKVSESSSDEKSLKKLKVGRIDAILMDKYVGASLVKSEGLSADVTVHPMPVHSDDIFFIFSKKSVSQDVVDRFNQALELIKASGEYDRIIESYLH